MTLIEHLLFAAHEGSVGSQRAAIIMQNHCLPIAVSHSSQQHEDGIHACWESTCDVEEFFAALDIANVCPGMGDSDPLASGLFVYTIEYDKPLDNGWEHLQGGEISRPIYRELSRLAWSKAPWGGGLVL